MKPGVRELIAYGLSSDVAESLYGERITPKKLQKHSVQWLLRKGLNSDITARIRARRPRIPVASAHRLLYESARTCCVCQDSTKPVIIHHLVSWTRSKDHSEKNLIVLCTIHHGEAHAGRVLELALKRRELRAAKKTWLTEVRSRGAASLVRAARNDDSIWDFINLPRFFPLLKSHGIDATQGDHYRTLVRDGVLDTEGTIRPWHLWNSSPESLSWMTSGSYCLPLGMYLESILNELVGRLQIRCFSVASLGAMCGEVRSGNFIAVQGKFYFRHLSKKESGPGQNKLAYAETSSMRIQAQIDVWNTLANSCKGEHLAGAKNVTFLFLVRSISRAKGKTVLSGSAIAIGSYFGSVDSV
jgi:hypothetical protein